MRHSLATTLSKRTKRITLFTYTNRMNRKKAVTTSTAIRDAVNMALGNGSSRNRCELLGCGIWKLLGLQPPPPELISPANRPTSPSLAHWLARNGRISCCRACSKAGEIASTAESGKKHLWRSRFAARYCAAGVGSIGFFILPKLQISDCRLKTKSYIWPLKFFFSIYNLQSAFYSYRSASTGSSLEARSAGTSPLATPTASNTREESMTVAREIC